MPDHLCQPEPECPIEYPKVWEAEYKQNGIVEAWREFPELCDEVFGKFGSCGTNMHMNRNKMGCFAEYGLMYLLRKRKGFHSITYLELGIRPKDAMAKRRASRVKAEVRRRREHLQGIMKEWMGVADFETLCNAIWESNGKSGYSAAQARFKGEPDLFCWDPTTGKWFLAEAKREDHFLESQSSWFKVVRDAISDVDLRLYRLVSDGDLELDSLRKL